MTSMRGEAAALAEQFNSFEQETEASQLGMWVFL